MRRVQPYYLFGATATPRTVGSTALRSTRHALAACRRNTRRRRRRRQRRGRRRRRCDGRASPRGRALYARVDCAHRPPRSTDALDDEDACGCDTESQTWRKANESREYGEECWLCKCLLSVEQVQLLTKLTEEYEAEEVRVRRGRDARTDGGSEARETPSAARAAASRDPQPAAQSKRAAGGGAGAGGRAGSGTLCRGRRFGRGCGA